MTRINSAIPPRLLTDEHLIAEHREIKRLPWYLQGCIRNRRFPEIPSRFTLGEGHMKFFLDKMGFLHRRYLFLHSELHARGFTPGFYGENWGPDIIGSPYYQDYYPTQEEYFLLISRIESRILESNKVHWHYCGKRITKEEAIKKLKERLN